MVRSADAGRRGGNAPAQAGTVGQCKGDTIRLGTKIGSFAAVAALALAAGGISAALLIPDVTVPGNIITAGHLQVEINHGNGSNLSIDNLAPGDSRTAYQLITGDMSGVDSADLSMTLSTVAPTPFTNAASLAIAVSTPFSEGTANGSSCSATTTFPVPVMQPSIMSSLSQGTTLGLGTFSGTDDAICVRFTIGLSEAAGNPVQGTSGELSMTYGLTQNATVTP